MNLIISEAEQKNLKDEKIKTIKDLIESPKYIGEIHTISYIRLDQKEYENLEELRNKDWPLTQFSEIEIKFKDPSELAYEALDSCPEYIQSLVDQITNLNKDFRKGDHTQGNKRFANFIEQLDLFIQLITNIQQCLRPSLRQDQHIKEVFQSLEMELLSILKAIIPAKEKNDLIMLCDLLEYELTDNLTQWKIKAIPELKRLQNN